MGEPARAAGTTAQFEVGQIFNWSDNPLLNTANYKDLWGSTTTPSVKISDKEPTRKIDIDLSVSRNQFNRSVFNSTDLHGKTLISRDFERWGLELSNKVDYESTRTSEETSYGRRDALAKRLNTATTPTLSYRPSEVSEVSIAGSFTRAAYDGGSYTDYQVFGVTPTYTRYLSSVSSVFVSADAQRYRTTEGIENTIDSVGPSLGVTHDLSPRISLSLASGAQASRQSIAKHPVGPWQWQQTFEGRAAFKGETDKVTFTAQRSQTPYGNGTQALRTEGTLDLWHAINEELSVSGSGNYSYSEYEQSANGSVRRTASGRAEITYKLNDACDLSASYRYIRQRLVGSADTAESNTAMLQLRLHPNGWSIGR